MDTGPLVALLNRRDMHYEWALQQWAGIEPPLITCEPVLSEACFLAEGKSRGAREVLALVVRGAIQANFRLATEAPALSELLARYANIPMSLADACLVRMAELNPGSPVLTIDSHFRVYRMHGRQVIPTIMPDR